MDLWIYESMVKAPAC